MDVYRALSIEFSGIKGEIEDYTSEKYILNILQELEKSIAKKERQDIIYMLDKVIIWYAQNMSKILSNEFVINNEIHKTYQKTLIDFYDMLREIGAEENLQKGDKREMKKIFISHASKDSRICTEFVEMLEHLGVPESDILYSSSERHGIPAGEDIFDYLRNHITEGINVFYMLSDNYYASAYCLNEMGAAWITQNEFSIFTLPNFSCGFKGVIDSKKKAYNLQSAADLITLKDKITKIYNSSISELKWEDIKNKFLKVVLAN